MKLGIYCAGSLGKEIYDIAIRINRIEERWERIVFIDDTKAGDREYGVEVCSLSDFQQDKKEIQIAIANGTPVNRKKIREKLISEGYDLASIIDPTTIVSPSAKLGSGIIVAPYSSVSSEAVLSDNVLIQSYVRIGHNMIVGEDSVISTNVSSGGLTTIGDQSYIGMGAVIRDKLKIGNNVIVSMGAIVHTDVEDDVIVAPIPSRISKKNVEGKVFRS